MGEFHPIAVYKVLVAGLCRCMEEPQSVYPGNNYIQSSVRPESVTAGWLNNFDHRRESFQLACNHYKERQTRWINSMKQRRSTEILSRHCSDSMEASLTSICPCTRRYGAVVMMAKNGESGLRFQDQLVLPRG